MTKSDYLFSTKNRLVKFCVAKLIGFKNHSHSCDSNYVLSGNLPRSHNPCADMRDGILLNFPKRYLYNSGYTYLSKEKLITVFWLYTTRMRHFIGERFGQIPRVARCFQIRVSHVNRSICNHRLVSFTSKLWKDLKGKIPRTLKTTKLMKSVIYFFLLALILLFKTELTIGPFRHLKYQPVNIFKLQIQFDLSKDSTHAKDTIDVHTNDTANLRDTVIPGRLAL